MTEGWKELESEERIARLLSVLEEKTVTISALETKLARLSAELVEQNHGPSVDQKNDAAKLHERILRLESALAKSESQKRNMEKQMASGRTGVLPPNASVEEYRVYVDHLERVLRTTAQSNLDSKKLQEEVDRLRQTEKLLREQIQKERKATSQLISVADDTKALKSRVADLEASESNLMSDLGKERAKRMEIEAQLEVASSEVRILSEKLRSTDALGQDLQKKVTEAHKSLEAKEGEVHTIATQLYEVQRGLQARQRSQTAHFPHAAEAEAMYRVMMADKGMDRVEEELCIARMTIASMQQEMATLKASHAKSLFAMEDRLAEEEGRCARFMKAADRAAAADQGEVSRLLGLLDEKESIIVNARATVDDLEAKCSQYEEALHRRDDMVLKSNQQLTDTTGELHVKNEQITSLLSSLDAAKSETESQRQSLQNERRDGAQVAGKCFDSIEGSIRELDALLQVVAPSYHQAA